MPDSKDTNKNNWGDPAGLESLFEQFLRRLIEWLNRRWVREYEAARDLAQDTFIKAWKNRKKYNPARPFKPWLYQIGKFLAIDRYRKQKRRPGQDPIDQPAVIAQLPSTPGPHQLHYEDQRYRLIWRILNELPRDQRFAIILCQLKKRKHQEAADRLGVKVRTLRENLYTGLEELGRRLEQVPGIDKRLLPQKKPRKPKKNGTPGKRKRKRRTADRG